MEYLCIKQLCIGGKVYYPGDILPDGAILPERVAKLSKSGYISALPESTKDPQSPVSGTVYTQEELENAAHNYELAESDSTVLCIDYSLNGIGSNSCGPVVLDQYRFDDTSFRFEFVWIPFAKN